MNPCVPPQQGHALLSPGCHRAFKHNASQGGSVCVRLKNIAQMKAAAGARLIAFQKRITSPCLPGFLPCTGEEAVFSFTAQAEEGVGGGRKVKQSYWRPQLKTDREGTTHLSRDLSYNIVLSIRLSSQLALLGDKGERVEYRYEAPLDLQGQDK